MLTFSRLTTGGVLAVGLLVCYLGVWGTLYADQSGVAAASSDGVKAGIQGRVVNSLTGEAVKRASLTLRPAGDGSDVGTATADSDDTGHFVFQGLSPGRYSLVAQRTGFATQSYGARSNPQSGTLLSLRAGQQLKDLIFKLAPNGVITGRVLDGEGEPMGAVTVMALHRGFRRGSLDWQRTSNGRTNDLGEFRISGLAAGSYIVAVLPPMTIGSLLGTGKPTDDKPKTGYAITYYPSAPDAAGAAPIRVEVGAETRLGDIQRLQSLTVRVAGKVVGNAVGAPGVVSLIPKDASGGVTGLGMKTTTVQRDGSFTITNVPPGPFILSGISSDLFGYRPVQVGDQNVEGLILSLGPGTELAGVMTVEGGNKIDLGKVHLLLQATDSQAQRDSGAACDANGNFTLRGVATARYELQLNNMPAGSYVKSVRLGGQDVTGGELNLTSGTAGPLRITLSLEAAEVTGVVRDSEEKPVAGAAVVLVPDTHRYSLYKEERTDQDGVFTLKDIAPGDYKLLAWEDIETDAYQDPAFLKEFEDRAEPLSLKPNDRRSVQVKVVPFEPL